MDVSWNADRALMVLQRLSSGMLLQGSHVHHTKVVFDDGSFFLRGLNHHSRHSCSVSGPRCLSTVESALVMQRLHNHKLPKASLPTNAPV